MKFTAAIALETRPILHLLHARLASPRSREEQLARSRAQFSLSGGFVWRFRADEISAGSRELANLPIITPLPAPFFLFFDLLFHNSPVDLAICQPRATLDMDLANTELTLGLMRAIFTP